MDFFAAQDRARRKTWQLVFLFILAIVGLIVATNVLLAIVTAFSSSVGLAQGIGGALRNQSAETWLLITGFVLICVAGASAYKYFALRSGGRAIVEMLGGVQIDPSTKVLAERRLLNVVEEMAIAAGMPVPAVYRVDEPGINAFAAGFGTDDAVIGVTAGTLENLNREELQGVIGHEFSHVLNGDSRLNLRLIALLNGILFLGIVGRLVLRGASTGSNRKSNSMPVVVLGVGLLVIGYAGTACGNLIKAAVSRQREFLADAASVQFTRNPHGIANALKKIGGAPSGSTLTNVRANEMSHMFFGQAVRLFLGSLTATHPPLPVRIRAIEPGWDGKFISGASAGTALDSADGVAGFSAAAPGVTPSAAPIALAQGDAIAAQVGNPTPASVTQAHALIGGLTPHCVDAAHEPFSARALVYALLRADDRASIIDRDIDERVRELELDTAGLDAMQRLTLASMALPALKMLSKSQYDRFVADVVALIKADRRIDLFEWVLHRVLLKTLKAHFEGAAPTPMRYRDLVGLNAQIACMLSAIARAGSADAAAQQRAFAAGAAAVGAELKLDTADDPNFTRLNDALKELRAVQPLVKPRLIKGCAAAALIDGVMPSERALLIGVAATLDCPLPPDLAL
ncbi:MAG TPA: M48 family metallopeptidase [Pseudomonadales bacterium]